MWDTLQMLSRIGKCQLFQTALGHPMNNNPIIKNPVLTPDTYFRAVISEDDVKLLT